MKNGYVQDDEQMLAQLRDILLTDDRAEIERLKSQLHEQDSLSADTEGKFGAKAGFHAPKFSERIQKNGRQSSMTG